MEEKRDLRVQKTYDALFLAFSSLLAEKSFDEITIKELCAKAKTRTATFYTHFNDKYDFFSFMVKELRKSFASAAELNHDKGKASTYYLELVKNGMEYLEDNDKMASSIKNNAMLIGILQFMPDEITNKLKSRLKEDSSIYKKLNNEDILLEFMIGGMNQVVEWWFSNRKKLDKNDIVSDMNLIIETVLNNK